MIETTGPGTRGGIYPQHAGGPSGGLTARTALVLLGVVTLGAALLSAASGRGFGIVFNLIFVVVAVYVALRIHVEDRLTAVVAPPIVYALSVFVASFFDSEETTRTLRRVIENSVLDITLGAPWLVITAVVTIVIAVLRGRRLAGRR